MASHRALPPTDLTPEGLNRRVVSELPDIRPCFGPCGRMSRPGGWSVEEYPDTVSRKNSFYCSACKRRLGGLRPAALRQRFEELEAERGDRPEVTPEAVLHAAKGLNRFMAQRQQREHRRERLAKIGNVAATHQPQPRGNGGGRVAADAYGPRPVPRHQQIAGTARVHAEGAQGRTDLLQRRA